MDRADPETPEPDAPATLDSAPPPAPPTPVVTSLPVAVAPDPGPRRRVPFLALSIGLVAILAGSALFMSGYTLGAQAASQPGTPASDDAAFQPFWDTYHTINDRYAGGEVDRDALVQGAIEGMIKSLGDPYSDVPQLDPVPREPAGHQRPVRGHRRGDRARRRRTAPKAARRSGPLAGSWSPSRCPGRRPRRPGCSAGDVVLSVDGMSLDGLTIEARATASAGRRVRP